VQWTVRKTGGAYQISRPSCAQALKRLGSIPTAKKDLISPTTGVLSEFQHDAVTATLSTP
jgi:hypothetical protein